MAKKRRAHEEERMDETWLIPYADLLTLLLALFIVLFAMSQVDQEKFEKLSQSLSVAFDGGLGIFPSSDFVPIEDEVFNPDANRDQDEFQTGAANERNERIDQETLQKFQQETADLEQLQDKIDLYIVDHQLDSQLETRLNHQELRITIRDTALFDSGSAILKTEAHNLAVAIAKMIKEHPQYEVKISGHTDNVPINTPEFPSNWDLSAKRALNFMKILLAHNQDNPGRFSAVGYGEYRPIDTNDTPEGRAKNRRVEISILRNYTDVIYWDVD